MTNGARLAAWRKAKGLSQEDAAKRIRVAQGTWAPWELEKKSPGRDNALAIEKLTRGAVRARDWKTSRTPKAPDSATDATTPTRAAG